MLKLLSAAPIRLAAYRRQKRLDLDRESRSCLPLTYEGDRLKCSRCGQSIDMAKASAFDQKRSFETPPQ